MTSATHMTALECAEDFLARALRSGADAAEVYYLRAVQLDCTIRNRIPETLERSESRGLGLRVFVGGAQAQVSTSEFSASALDQMAQQAIAIARASPPDAFATLAPASLLAIYMPELDVFDAHEPDITQLQAQCKTLESLGLAYSGITNTEGASAAYSAYETALVTSDGFCHASLSSYSSLSLSLIAGTGANMQRDYAYSTARHGTDLSTAETLADEAATRTLARLNPRKIASGAFPLVFEPRVARSIVSALTSAINGNAITRGTSFLKSSLHQPVFSASINIFDDPHRMRGIASRPVDAEGVATQKTALIDGGILTTWLLDVRSANQLQSTPTGHASRQLGSTPYPGTSNCYMAAGSLTPQALMSDIKEGVYITEVSGMGVNLITGDYSQGAAGFMIRNGVIAEPVSEFTIAGHLRKMFLHLTPANDLQFTYATNAPTLRIDGMTVAGI